MFFQNTYYKGLTYSISSIFDGDLWTFDGSTRTRLNLEPSSLYNFSGLTVYKDKLYFLAMIETSPPKLYSYDGTTVMEAGTQSTSQAGCSFASSLDIINRSVAVLDDKIYLWCDSTRLFTYDGEEFEEVFTTPQGLYATSIFAYAGEIYFSASDLVPLYGTFWKISDGVAIEVVDYRYSTNNGVEGPTLSHALVFKNKLYAFGYDADQHQTVLQYDGTSLRSIQSIANNQSLEFSEFFGVYGGKLYLIGQGTIGNSKLYTFDGVNLEESLFSKSKIGSLRNVSSLSTSGNQLFFQASGIDPFENWLYPTALTYASCLSGTYQSEDKLSCIKASPGYFVDSADASKQTACAIGYYSSKAGSTECLAAPIGTYVDEIGQAFAKICQLGTYSAVTASDECLLAPANYYVDELGASSAKACPAESITEGAGATSIQDCYIPQVTCEPGTFLNQDSTGCLDAQPGFYVATVNSNVQIPCPAGRYTSVSKSISCVIAPKGYYTSTSASTAPTACPRNQVTAREGSTAASACYLPVVQTLVGFKAPKGLKFNAKTILVATTTAKAITKFKTTGPCSAKIITVVTKVKGKKVSSKALSVTAGKKTGTCKIVQTSVAVGKYIAFTKSTSIKISRTGK